MPSFIPNLSTLLPFMIAALTLNLTPGADMTYVIARSAGQGRLAGISSAFGISAGALVHTLLAAVGLSALVMQSETAFQIIKFAGAAYLLYLAWKAWRSGDAEVEQASRPPASLGRIFTEGMLTNLLNPKMALFVLALFPQFVRPSAGSVFVQIMLLATVLNLIGLLVNGFVIMTASRLGRAFSGRNRLSRAPQLLLGAVFVGLAARLAFDGRR
jgi:threonine/homoserine/homoserine lactone efflux protein